MPVDESIAKYDHPYLTVDGVLFRYKSGVLQVRLYWNESVRSWCLPGGFVPVDREMADVLAEKMYAKVGAAGFYAEQLRTYDALDRDYRGRVISVAYLCLTADQSGTDGWFDVGTDGGVQGLQYGNAIGFDHEAIIRDARERLANKLWWSDLPRHLLPRTFRISEIQGLYEHLEGSRYYSNFKRDMGHRIVQAGVDDDGTPGRKAALYRWLGIRPEGGK